MDSKVYFGRVANDSSAARGAVGERRCGTNTGGHRWDHAGAGGAALKPVWMADVYRSASAHAGDGPWEPNAVLAMHTLVTRYARTRHGSRLFIPHKLVEIKNTGESSKQRMGARMKGDET